MAIALALIITGLFYGAVYSYYQFFYLPKQSFLRVIHDEPFDAVIIPGIPYDGESWSPVMKWRVHWSALLYHNGLSKNIIYSGGAVYTPFTEAKIMALYGEKLGIDSNHIYIETKAEHTTENLYYSYQLALSKGFRKIGFATDPFQSQRIVPFIKQFNIRVTAVPIVIPMLDNLPMKDYKINAMKAYDPSFVSIKVRETPEQRDFYSRGGRIFPQIK